MDARGDSRLISIIDTQPKSRSSPPPPPPLSPLPPSTTSITGLEADKVGAGSFTYLAVKFHEYRNF